MGSIYEKDLNRAVQFYSQIADEYQWKGGEDIELQKRLIEPLKPDLRATSLVLDLCCGSGCFVRGLSAAGFWRYIGVDAAEGMIARARREFPDKDFRVGRAESLLTVVPEICDGFTIVHGFAHIPPSVALTVLRSLRAVLREGAVGVAVIGATTDYPQSRVIRRTGMARERRKAWDAQNWPDLIAVAWNVEEFCRCFERTGFRRLNRTSELFDPDNIPLYFEAV